MRCKIGFKMKTKEMNKTDANISTNNDIAQKIWFFEKKKKLILKLSLF